MIQYALVLHDNREVRESKQRENQLLEVAAIVSNQIEEAT